MAAAKSVRVSVKGQKGVLDGLMKNLGTSFLELQMETTVGRGRGAHKVSVLRHIPIGDVQYIDEVPNGVSNGSNEAMSAAAPDPSTTAPKRRGRPRKAASEEAAPDPSTTAPKRRGRPRKVAAEKVAAEDEASAPKRRGRPRKVAAEDEVPKAKKGKKRGRPKKSEAFSSAAPSSAKRGRPKSKKTAKKAKPTIFDDDDLGWAEDD